jgi:RimJ/RimL family protein N-acetyltransferase
MSDIAIRAIRPDDKTRLVKAFRGLERESVYLRFFSYKKELSQAELRQVTECDGLTEVELVATVGSGEEETIVALGGYVRRGATAEIAFAVEEDFQRRGIARRLLRELTHIARASGIRQFEADVLAGNAPMLNVFRRSGLPMLATHEADVVHATLLLA